MFLYLFMRERGLGDLVCAEIIPSVAGVLLLLSRICAVCFCSITQRCGAGRRFHPRQFVTQLCAAPREPTRETHTTQRAKAEINYIHKQAGS